MIKTYSILGVLFLGAICLVADFNAQPQMHSHQEIKHEIVYNNQGLPIGVNFWAYNLQVPIIDGMVWWPDAIGYALHAWYDLDGQQQSQSKDVSSNNQNQVSSESNQSVLPPLQPKSFQIQKPEIEYVPLEVPESINIVCGNQASQSAGCYVRVNMNNRNVSGGVTSMSDKEFASWWRSQIAYQKYHRMKYHMSSQQKDKLMSTCRYKNFTEQLLEDDTLAEDVVFELWQQFCDSKSWPFGDDRWECDQQIKRGLKDRARKRGEVARQKLENVCKARAEQIQAEIDEKSRKQAQAQRAQKYQQLNNFHDYVSPFQEQRQEALRQTIEQNYQQTVQSHEVDAQAAAMLQTNGMDHRQLHGLACTAFQHQLFGEVAWHYQNAAKIMFEYSINNSCIVPHLLVFAQATFDATKLEQLGLAVQLSNVAQLLAETSLSICKGPIESICCLADAAWNLRETVSHLGQALTSTLRVLGGALVAYDHESSGCCTSAVVCQEAFGKDLIAFTQMKKLSEDAFVHWYEHSSGQEKIQTTSKMISDVVLQPFLLGKAGKACWGLISQASELRALEGLACLADELGFAEVVQDLSQIVSKEESLVTVVGDIEVSLGSLVEAEVVAVIKPAGFVNVICEESFLKNIESLQASNAFYKNTPLQKQAMSYFDRYFYQKELLEFCTEVEKTHSVMMVQHLGKEVKMICNPRHMMTYQLDFRNIASLGQAEGLIGGGHVGLFYDDLISHGFLKVIQDIPLNGGCRALEFGHVFGNNAVQKTLWPKNWTAQQIMEAIKDAWHNPIQIVPSLYRDNLFFMLCQDLKGVRIEVCFEIMKDASMQLKTAYPHYSNFSKTFKI